MSKINIKISNLKKSFDHMSGSITLFNEVIRNVVPGRTNVLDFSFIDTTDLTPVVF